MKENASKSLKNAQKTQYSAKVILRYFQKYARYESNVFWGPKQRRASVTCAVATTPYLLCRRTHYTRRPGFHRPGPTPNVSLKQNTREGTMRSVTNTKSVTLQYYEEGNFS